MQDVSFSVHWWTARNKVSNPTICGVEDWKFTVHDGVNNGLDGTFWKLSITVTDTNLWNKKLVFYILCALQHTRVLQLLIFLTADSWIAKDWEQVASTLMPEVNSRLTLLQDESIIGLTCWLFFPAQRIWSAVRLHGRGMTDKNRLSMKIVSSAPCSDV